MKKIFMLLPLLLCFSVILFSQSIAGLWAGKLDAGVTLTLVFHFSQDENKKFSVLIDCPEQSIKGIRANSVSVNNDSVNIEVTQIGGNYSGKIINDSTIEGSWLQGRSVPLILKRTNEIKAVVRSQTPKPPFPYKTEDVIYFNKDKSIQYGATITIPQSKGPFPAALLITGSGQQNRDEEILNHKPFAVIADYLTRIGFIVLRVDDRGMGQTTGDLKNATSRDFANDAIVSFDFLKERKEVNKTKMGLIGHSEGGMIAEMIAAERKNVDFIILLAGPGEKITKLMSDQNAAILITAGLPKEYVDQYLNLYNSILPAIANSVSNEDAKQKSEKIVTAWLSKTPHNIVLATTGIKDDKSKEQFVDVFVQQVGSPWFKYFLKYDPKPVIKNISAKVLALNGDRDVQVISKTNLPGIEAALKKSKSKLYEIKELKGLNHLFQHCTTCTTQEYGQLDETFSPEALKIISDWLVKNVK